MIESDKVVCQMNWPSLDFDINPVEMIWEELDCRVKTKKPTRAQHLRDLLQDGWTIISGVSS